MLTPTRFERLAELFERAQALPLDQRAAFVMEAAGTDQELRAELESLLAADARAGARVGAAVAEAAGAVAAADAARIGRRVGPYRVASEIGAGGMGSVFLAERSDGAYEGKVAVKFLRGFPDRDALARFARERQILATLRHPHIAPLLDGGTTDDGQPWLAMAYVEGKPIDRWCDERTLSIERRLALFAQVCAAIQHAHQHLVIHRDIKPSNVLVDDEGQVQVLDFGIARLLDDAVPAVDATASRLYFTPGYASPEQRRGERVGTASDIYSLGVLLHVLLTGHTATEAITRPSRVPIADAEAAARASTVSVLRRRLRGDLDAIVSKALSDEPGRRYASAQALADDLGRYLRGAPVQARPDSLPYRAGKLVRRYPAVSGLLLAALAMALVFTLRVIAERDRARAAEQQARAQASRAEEVTKLLVRSFAAANPERGGNAATPVSAVLEEADRALATSTLTDPAVRAQLEDALAEVMNAVGMNQRALALWAEALAEHDRAKLPEDDAFVQFLGNYTFAAIEERQLDLAGTLLARLTAIGERDFAPTDQRLGRLRNVQGFFALRSGQWQLARERFEQAVAFFRVHPGDEPTNLSSALHQLATALREEGRPVEAEQAIRESLAINRAALGDHHPRVLRNLNSLSALLATVGKFGEAVPVVDEAVTTARAIYPAGSSMLSVPLAEAAAAMHDAGRYPEAFTLYREAIEIDRASGDLGRLSISVNNYGVALAEYGNYDEAERAHRESLALRTEVYGAINTLTSRSHQNLARLELDRDRLEPARVEAERALDIRRQTLGEAHIDVAASLALLAQIAAAQGRHDEARTLMEDAEQRFAAALPETHLRRVDMLRIRAKVLAAGGDDAASVPAFERYVERSIPMRGATHPVIAAAKLELAAVLDRLGREKDAAALRAEAGPIVEQSFAPESPARRMLASAKR